jgi:hypothetical protein
VLGAVVVAPPDSTVTCRSFLGRGLGSPGPAGRARVPGHICPLSGRVRCVPGGVARVRDRKTLLSLTIYALMTLEDTWLA